MKVIIAGGRDFDASPDDVYSLDRLHNAYGFTEVVSGGARGADLFGEIWADGAGLPVRVFRADWDHLGARAGFIRNAEMAAYADALIAFPGGSGTADMIARATRRGLLIWRAADGRVTPPSDTSTPTSPGPLS